MCGVAHYRVIQVSDLNSNSARCPGYWAQVSDMTVPADPNRRAVWESVVFDGGKPVVELHGVASNEGVRRTGHLLVSSPLEHRCTVVNIRRGGGAILHALPIPGRGPWAERCLSN